MSGFWRKARKELATAGYRVPPNYDSLIAKVIVWDESRPAAIARSLRALREFELAGVPTTIPTAVEVLSSRGFQEGEYSTGYLSELGLVVA